MSIRILAGKYKGISIEAPSSARPTLSRSRQVLFDILESMSSNLGHFWRNKKVFDCFAGSGAFGIEALSRGADFVYFCEINKQAINILYRNIKQLNAQNRCRIIHADICQIKISKKYPSETCDVLFFDPPYGKVSISKTIEYLRNQGWIQSNSLIITEEEKRLSEDLSKYTCLKTKEIGDSSFKFLQLSD